MVSYILLTGGTGFLGSHILNKLIESNYPVIVLVRKTSGLEKIAHLSGKYASFVINDSGSNMSSLFEQYNINTIIHTATEYGRESSIASILETNVIFPLKLIEEGIKHKLGFFINTDSFFSKDQNLNSSYLNHYARSKKIFKDLLLDFSKSLNVASLQLEHVYGENDSNRKFFTGLLEKLLSDSKEVDLTSGSQKRDFIYVDDVVDAFLKILENRSTLNGFNEFEVGTGSSVSVREFVEEIARISGSHSKLLFGKIPTRLNEIEGSVANITPLAALGWKSNFPIEKAIKKIIKIERNKLK